MWTISTAMDKKYRELHNEYIKALVTYHNAYVKYIEGVKAKHNYSGVRQSLLELRRLNRGMLKELTQVRRNKVEDLAKKNKYQEQRTRIRKRKNDDVNNSSN